MQVLRMYTGPDGESHFEDLDIEFGERLPTGRYSEIWKAKGVRFREVQSDFDMEFHVAPNRRLMVNLTGEVEYEVGSGEKRVCGPGSITLIEDLAGKGHMSRSVGDTERTCLIILLDPES